MGILRISILTVLLKNVFLKLQDFTQTLSNFFYFSQRPSKTSLEMGQLKVFEILSSVWAILEKSILMEEWEFKNFIYWILKNFKLIEIL